MLQTSGHSWQRMMGILIQDLVVKYLMLSTYFIDMMNRAMIFQLDCRAGLI